MWRSLPSLLTYSTGRPARILTLSAVALILGGFLVAGCASTGSTGEMDREKLMEMADADSSSVSRDVVSTFDASMSTRLEEIVASRFPSVHVSYGASDRMYLQIRGANSLHPNHEQPLIVVDGIPHYAPAGYSLIGINPEDVATIDVLKGPRATGRWGRQGIDGVIVITTKRGG